MIILFLSGVIPDPPHLPTQPPSWSTLPSTTTPSPENKNKSNKTKPPKTPYDKREETVTEQHRKHGIHLC